MCERALLGEPAPWVWRECLQSTVISLMLHDQGLGITAGHTVWMTPRPQGTLSFVQNTESSDEFTVLPGHQQEPHVLLAGKRLSASSSWEEDGPGFKQTWV